MDLHNERKESAGQTFHADRLQAAVFLYAGLTAQREPVHMPCHVHACFSEILYVRRGTGRILLDGRAYEARPGMLAVVDKGVAHEEWYAGSDLEVFYCAVADTGPALEDTERGNILPRKVCPVIEAGAETARLDLYMTELSREAGNRDAAAAAACKSLVQLLLISIYRAHIAAGQLEIGADRSPVVNMVAAYIEEHYAQPIRLNDLAAANYISPYYLTRLFKAEMGDTPINYVIKRRILAAKSLLASEERSVQEVAAAVGYDNCTHFTALFKKSAGCTPNEYKKRCRTLLTVHEFSA